MSYILLGSKTTPTPQYQNNIQVIQNNLKEELKGGIVPEQHVLAKIPKLRYSKTKGISSFKES